MTTRIPLPRISLNVGIVGGGMAGLYAALLLQTHGHRVRIFEGTDRVGGRVHTHYFTQEKDQFFEAGAMRLPHSDFQQYTFDLISWLHSFDLQSDRKVELIPYVLTSPGNRLYVNGVRSNGYQVSSITPQSINWDVPDEYKGQTAGDLLMKAIGGFIKKLEDNFEIGFEDLVKNWDNFSFRFYLVDVLRWPTSVIDFVETVTSQTNQFALSVPEMVMQNMDFDTKTWSTIKHGMSRLPSAMSYLVGYKNITYGARVTGIKNTDVGKVTITAIGYNGRIDATFDKVILAIPPAALKMIADRPRWSIPKEVAIRSMHFEALYKMGLRFKTRFWERVAPKSTRGGQSTTDLPIRWIVYPSNGMGEDGPGVLLVYAWMTDATTWLPLMPTERRSLALFCLAQMYNGEVDTRTKTKIDVYDLLIGTSDAVWSTKTATGDAMFLPGQFASRFEAARQPEDNIYFAGEHLSYHHTWIAGALESGHKAVCDMIGKVSPLKGLLRTGHPEQYPHHIPKLDPTLPPEEAELDYGAPLLLGSRGDEATPDVEYQFSPHEPLFKFNDGWAKSDHDSAAKFPLDLGGDPRHAIGVEITHLAGPGAGSGRWQAIRE
ncbi:flavin-containing amine oxidoreductase-domain containing protein [Multifurca ochricompacta]|uniref:Amine oxidase n=1 Tax=Multifurca ochricompacta TaxID=376703 RepID=A0AAD4M5L3_9AGAM|nr:flavin-containing amine oxidoreductase-domain containing protein [Multifurca ochricompacta]